MDEHQGTPPREESFAQKTARLLEKLRAKSNDLRAEEDARWGDLEMRLEDNLGAIDSEILRQQEEIAAERANVKAQVAEVALHQDDAGDEQRELAEYLQEQQNRLALREHELSQREQLVAQAEKAQHGAETHLANDRSELDRARSQLQEREASLSHQSEQLATDRQLLKEQRQVVGEKLRHQRREQQAANDQERATLHDRLAALDVRLAEVARREEELDRHASESEKYETLAERHRTTSEERDTLRKELEVAVGTRDAITEALADAERKLAEANGELSEKCEALAKQHSEALADAERKLAEANGELSEKCEALAKQHEAASHERDTLRKDLASAAGTRDALAEALAETEGKLDKANEVLAAQPNTSELETKFDLAVEEARELRAHNADLEDQLAALSNAASHDPDELANLRIENAALIQQVEELRIEPPTDSDDARQQELDDLRERFEMAVEDVRRLKTEKEELEQKVAECDHPYDSRGGATGALDWAAVKVRLMASLDDDFDSNNEEELQDKTTIEGTIRITDDIISEKEKEIFELKQLLKDQSGSIGEVAVGAGAVAELFDQDESIRQERERLNNLQSEWEDKLRQSELEISVQRAKLARERNDIDRKRQELDELHAEIKETASAFPNSGAGKPRRRWLARLGLNKEGED